MPFIDNEFSGEVQDKLAQRREREIRLTEEAVRRFCSERNLSKLVTLTRDAVRIQLQGSPEKSISEIYVKKSSDDSYRLVNDNQLCADALYAVMKEQEPATSTISVTFSEDSEGWPTSGLHVTFSPPLSH